MSGLQVNVVKVLTGISSSSFLFNILPNKPHTERKRMFVSKYTKTHVQNSPELAVILETIISLRVRPRMRTWAENGTSVDMLSETKAVFMDMITAYTFGPSNGTNFVQNRAERDYYFEILRKSSEGFFWRTEFSNLAYWLHWCGIALNGVYHSKLEVERWCYALCTKARDSPTRSLPNPSVYTQLRSNLEASGLLGPVLDKTLAAETLDHLIASYDASGIIVTYLMYELSKRPALQQALRTELSSIELPQASSIFPVVPLDRLPLLDTLLLETLRLYASSPGPKPRCTPALGAQIGGFANIPPGTVVSAFGYGLHRNASVFFQPEEWLPERWLRASQSEKVEMMKWFWAFGSGTRMCIGSHYAMQSKFVLGGRLKLSQFKNLHMQRQARVLIYSPSNEVVCRFRVLRFPNQRRG